MRMWALSAILFSIVWSWSSPLKAEMQALDDEQLNGVSAQVGITIALDKATFYDEYTRISFRDSNNTGSLAFGDVVVDNGSGWGYSFSTTTAPLTIDLVEYAAPYLDNWGILTYGEENVALSIVAQGWQQDLTFTANNLYFCGQDMGKLKIGPIRLMSFSYMLTTPDFDLDTLTAFARYDTDHSGLYYRYKFRQNIDTVSLTYNSAGQALTFSQLKFAEHFSNSATTQTSDANASGSFLIGKDDSPNNQADFAQVNLIKEGSNVELNISMPMSGSIRMNSVQIGTRNCGPVAIDGIEVHNMTLKFIP